MFGKQMPSAARSKDEGEKPFWISFADLMTAMMILFLVVTLSSMRWFTCLSLPTMSALSQFFTSTTRPGVRLALS